MKKTTKYMVVTMDSWRIIQRGFTSWEAAYQWRLNHDWGQYEQEGGLTISSYFG